jgi:hypothetical protein
MTPTDPITAQVTAAAACAFVLQGLQKWKALPWVTAHTATINLVAKAALSFGATLGISKAWTPAVSGGGVLMITIPPATVLVLGVWHWFGQFSMQHIIGQTLSIGTIKAVDNPVQVNEGGK